MPEPEQPDRMEFQAGPNQSEPPSFGRNPYPPAQFPTIYADGVWNTALGPQVVKFYLYRSDPNFGPANVNRNTPFAQVIMPTISFVQTALFFERALSGMVDQSMVPKEMVDQMRSTIAGDIRDGSSEQ